MYGDTSFVYSEVNTRIERFHPMIRQIKEFFFHVMSSIVLESLFLSILFFPLVIIYTISKDPNASKKNV